MQINTGAVLSLIATLVVGVIFLLMVLETIAVARGRDPITNRVREAVRQYPRLSYVIAVVIGIVLGHLFWQ